ncbi:cationic amino acid transporter 4 [Procambarus clarkii]|uniref:cationic amino acid transporter 4 n=1 Tax=Procambarus clarkii TaxID=6728 RepID=UPI001E6743EC|nr:cationic amino acid transporter 2-like [Procambarus clarkii]
MTPPLLHSRRRQTLASSARHIYAAFVRTRPFAHQNPRTSVTTPTPTPGIWGDCGRGLGVLVYRSVGLWAVLGVTYVVGIVAGPIAGPAVSSSLLVAAVTSLLTGFCYTELVTWSGQSSGQLYTVTYQLVGELVAFVVGCLNTLFAAATLAAVGKSLSATMDYLSGGKVERFVATHLGRLPGSQAAPDFIAAGASLSVAVILAFGLEQSGFLRATMSVATGVALVFFLAVGATHTEQDPSHLHHALNIGSSELLAGAAVCVVIYSGFHETGRLAKQHRRPHRAMPIAISLATGLAFLAFFALGIVLTLMTGNSIPSKGAPLIQALERRDVGWARLVLGSFQVVMLCLALVEAANPLSRQLVSLATDGLLPPTLAHQCSRTTAHAHAHLFGGTMAAFLALLFSHVLLLQVLATCALCLHVVVVLAVMYRRHRCSYGSLCSVAATASSSAPYSYQRLAPPHSRQERTFHFLKDGMRVLPQRVRTHKDATPAFTSPDSESGVSGLDPETRDTAPLLDYSEDSLASPLRDSVQLEAVESTNQQQQQQQTSASDTESAASGYGTDTDAEDDIDAAVAEYQEKLKVATLDMGVARAPTVATARRACVALTALLATVIVAAFVAVYGWRDGGDHPLLVVVLSTTMLAALVLVALLTRLPTLHPSNTTTFRVPAAPWLPSAALLLNVILLVQVLRHSWAVISLYTTAGLVWYFTYGVHHSALATLGVVTARGRSTEIICMEPLAPPALTPTLLQASPQLLHHPTHQQHFTRLTQVDTVLITR